MPEFGGFQPQDFDELAGSTWRGRDSLGGLLAKKLRKQLGRPYQSWGVRRRLEVHLAHEGNYAFDNPWPYAKLFVYSQREIAFGFYVETPRATRSDVDQFVHWRNFRDRLGSDPIMQTALLSAMANHGLMMADYYRQENGGALRCKFQFKDGQLQWWRPDDPVCRDVSANDMFRRLGKLPEDEWVDLNVFASIDKQKAIQLGPRVVDRILPILRALAPVYEMTL